MDHFPIIKSLARVALAQGDDTVRHQVERLAGALRKVDDQDAAAFERLLSGSSMSKGLAPSRLTKSTSVAVAPEAERMSVGVAVPVDRESSAPLATIVFPDANKSEFPILPADLNETVAGLLLEWENRDLVKSAGLKPSLTCLIYGPPGTGKTTLALWLAKRMGLPAVVARLDGLMSSFLGTTARNLGALFAFANRYECMLILDEFDAIAKVRDDPNEVGEIKRVVNTLLQNIDAREGRGITIGLTNHHSLLDPAVWRRFDVQLAVPLPSDSERLAISKSSLEAIGADSVADAKLLARVSEGFSGAELVTLCEKYRKRRLLSPDENLVPFAAITLLASSTSLNINRKHVLSVGAEQVATQDLAAFTEIKFSQTELAYLFGVSTKTISRRIKGPSDEGVTDV